MPLLPAEDWWFPQDLFTIPDPASTEPWWVLHTHPRAEKSIARVLHGHQVPFFLPVYQYERRSNGRKLTTHQPLFPGYLFLRAGDEGRLRALETNQVVNCLQVPDQTQLRQELDTIQRVMVSGAPIGPESQLQPGDPVLIVRGPLSGIQGSFLRRGNRLTLVVKVNFLQKGVFVEIEDWMVESLPRSTPVNSFIDSQ